MPYISAQVAVSAFTHLHRCDLTATQVNVAVSQAECGLCNVVFGRAPIPEQENPLNARKANGPPVLYPQNIPLFFFIYSTQLVYLPLLCPYLTPSSILCSLSHFELLSFSSCHQGKQNTVAMETAHREERGSLWDFQCGDRRLYMAISCLRAGRWVQPSMNIVSLFPDRQSEKDWGTQRGETKRQQERVWPGWYRSLDLAGTVLLLLDHAAFSLLHNTTHTIPSSTSLLFCYDSHCLKTHWQTFYITAAATALQTCKSNTQPLNTDQCMNVN